MIGEHSRSSERTILFAPGLRQPLNKVEPFLDGLSETGVSVIASKSDGMFSLRALDKEFRNQRDEWPMTQLFKANNLYRTFLESNAIQADVIGYCEGGVTGTILANVHPEVVSRLLLINPAGITKEEGPERLIGRFKDKNQRYVKAIIDDVMSGRIERSTYRMAWSNINRILGMKALASLSRVYMVDTLQNLADSGMEVSIIHGYKDRLYPYEDVSSHVPLGIHAHASFANRSVGHAVLETHPDDALRSVIQVLELGHT